jgi:NADH-quinone oxidoreductase subunit H
MFHVIAGLKSKYATLACARLALLSIMMEIFFAACFLFCYAVYGGYTLEAFADSGALLGPLATAVPPLGAFFFLYALFEAKRAPFDHTEAESELVAGHMVEFAGRSLLFFYLAEYAHFFFCLFLVSCLCFSYTSAWSFACT